MAEELVGVLSTRGTASFVMSVEESVENGLGAEQFAEPVFVLPGLGSFLIDAGSHSIDLRWNWDETGSGFDSRDLMVQVPTLPGPGRFHVLVTWDVGRRVLDMYIDGVPVKQPGAEYGTWDFAGSADEWLAPSDRFRVERVVVTSEYLDEASVPLVVPAEMLGKSREVFAVEALGREALAEDVRGSLLYAADLLDASSTQGWVMEGAGLAEFDGEGMILRSARPDASEGEHGHFVYWVPEVFPESFVAQWDARVLSEFGLTIMFFAAHGASGQDFLAPGAPARDGTFSQYIRGDINSYHISYFASTENLPGRLTSNLRKNNKFFLLQQGPTAIKPGDPEWKRMTLVKDKDHIRLLAGDEVILDFVDDNPARHGPPHGAGRIGFRQMQWTTAQYRDFRVCELDL